MSTPIPRFNGDKLRRARLQAGVSLRDKRWPWSVSDRRIAKYQSGKKQPRFETVLVLAQVLGCDPTDFYDVEGSDVA